MTGPDALLRGLLAESARMLRPLARAAEGPLPESVVALATRAGIGLRGVPPDDVRRLADRIRTAWAPLENLAESGDAPPPADVPALVEAVQELVGVVREVDELLAQMPDAPQDAPKRLLDLLVAEHLARERPLLHATLRLIGVLARTPDGERLRLAPDVLPRFLEAPARTVHAAHRDGDGAFDVYALLRDVRDVARGVGAPASFQHPHEDDVATLGGDPFAELPDVWLRVLLLLLGDDPGVAFGLAFLPVTARPEDDERGGALAIVPFGASEAGRRRRLSAGWVVGMTSTIGVATRQAVVVTANGAQVLALDGDDVPGTVSLGAVLESENRSQEPSLVLGDPDGMRLEVGVLGVRVAAEVGGDPDLVVRLPLLGCRLVLEPDESLVGALLGGRRVEAAFDVVPAWSSRHGLSFDGSDGLSMTTAVHGAAGPVEVRRVTVEVAPADGGLRVQAAAAVRTRLGPVTLTVDGVGLDATATLPAGADGELGVLDASLRPTTPNSVAVLVEAPRVRGGGQLAYDAVADRWAGAVHLEVAGVSVAAVGLLTRTGPSWSFLVAITADGFSPVPLGAGFVLLGVGGLVGVHREADVDVLRAGLGDGTLDALLFPDDPLGGTVELLDELAAAFPHAQDRHVVGPTALLGWGTPTLVTAELALAVGLPEPVRMVAVGRIRACLPDADRPVVRLVLDALGVVDLDDRRAALDARLHDSRIAGRAAHGEAALRARWGDDPAFVLAAGGHHPRFTPPPGLPSLERLSVDLVSGAAQVRLDAYLALTASTAQVGARLELHADVSALSLDAHLGFDALLELAPFGFVVGVAGSAAVRWKGKTLAGARLALTLSGPAPLRARGDVELTLWRWSHTVGFDVTMGGAPDTPIELVPADPLPRLLKALAEAQSWTGIDPGRSPVELRVPQARQGKTFVHPLATLEVRQQVVPLGVDVTRVGRRPVEGGERRFTLAATVAGADVASDGSATVRDHLAPARFLDLTDAERLSGPSFERLPVGVRLAAPGLTTAEDALTAGAPVGRRTRVVDPLDGGVREADERPARRRSRRDFADASPPASRADVPRADVRPPSYVIADAVDLGVDATLTPSGGWRTRTEAVQALRHELQRRPSRVGLLQVVGWHESAGAGLRPQPPGERPLRPGEYVEVDPEGGRLQRPRQVTMEPGDTPLPPTRRPGLRWQWAGPPMLEEALT